MNARRWIVVIVAAALVIGLVATARGRDHHRGDDVGALRAWSPGASAGVGS